MINDEYELCFAGQLDSISPEDVDFYVTARVTDFVNINGIYSLQAVCPEDYHGEQYLEWELTSGAFTNETPETKNKFGTYTYHMVKDELEQVTDKYSSLIQSELWDIIISEQNEEAYDYAEANRYDDF